MVLAYARIDAIMIRCFLTSLKEGLFLEFLEFLVSKSKNSFIIYSDERREPKAMFEVRSGE